MGDHLYSPKRMQKPHDPFEYPPTILKLNMRCEPDEINFKLHETNKGLQKIFKQNRERYVEQERKRNNAVEQDKAFFKKMDEQMRRKSPGQIVQTSLERISEIRYTVQQKQLREKRIAASRYTKLYEQILHAQEQRKAISQI